MTIAVVLFFVHRVAIWTNTFIRSSCVFAQAFYFPLFTVIPREMQESSHWSNHVCLPHTHQYQNSLPTQCHLHDSQYCIYRWKSRVCSGRLHEYDSCVFRLDTRQCLDTCFHHQSDQQILDYMCTYSFLQYWCTWIPCGIYFRRDIRLCLRKKYHFQWIR